MKFPKINLSRIPKNPYTQIQDKISLLLSRRKHHIESIREIEGDLENIEKSLKKLIRLSKNGKRDTQKPKIYRDLEYQHKSD